MGDRIVGGEIADVPPGEDFGELLSLVARVQRQTGGGGDWDQLLFRQKALAHLAELRDSDKGKYRHALSRVQRQLGKPVSEQLDRAVWEHSRKQVQASGQPADAPLRIRWPAELRTHLAGRYLVKGLVPQGLLQTFGPPNEGKTAFVIDLALHIACGRAYRGRRTRHLWVWYAALEAAESVENRIVAWCRHHDIEVAELQLIVATGALNLLDAESVDAACESLRAARTTIGEGIGLLVIDTQTRAMPGANENAGEDITRALVNADRLRAAAGDASLMLIHHAGKDDTRGARGHSSQFAAMDAVFEVRAGQISVRKARDSSIADPLAFEIVGVELGRDEDGDPVTAAVAVESNVMPSKPAAPKRELTAGSKLALKVLRQLLTKEGQPVTDAHVPPQTRCVQLDRWRGEHRQHYDTADAARKAWGRALEELQATPIVGVYGDFAWINERKQNA